MQIVDKASTETERVYMNITEVISQMGVIFIVLAVGYAANKLKVINRDSNKLLTRLVLNIAMPCTILNSVMAGNIDISGAEAAFFMLMVLLTFAIAFILVIPVPKLLGTIREDSGLTGYMIVFGNVGFMGFPVAEAIFGPQSAFFVALFNIPFSILAYSVGILMVSGKGDKINFRLFINPSLIASLLAILIFVFKISAPLVVVKTTGLIGQMTTPAAVMVIGSTLASIPLKEVFGQRLLYSVTVIKLVAVPLITWLILRLFVTNELMLGILVVLSGMPTASNATMLCMEYGGNERLASKGVFLTTLFSVVTIPLLVFMMSML